MEVENLIFNIRRQGGAQGALDGLRGSLRNLEGQSKKTTSALGKLVESLKRIAFYRVVRAAIKELSQAFQDGLQNVYAYSDAIGGTLAKALDGLKSSSTQMKNALGSAFGELLQNIRPILITIINLVTRAANAIAQLFAVLGGRSTYSKAVATAEKWADATASGSKAAKEWKNQLLGFDVINKLQEPSDSGGGSGAATNPLDMFEEEPAVNKWAEEFRRITLEWLDSVDFSKITAAFDKLKESIKGLVGVIDKALYWAYTEVLLPLAKWVIEDAAPASMHLLASMVDVVTEALKRVLPYFETLWENVLKPFAQWIGDEFVLIIERLSEIFEGLADVISGKITWEDFWADLSDTERLLLFLAEVAAIAALAILAINHPIAAIAFAIAGLVAVFDKKAGDIKQKFEDFETWCDETFDYGKVEEFREKAHDLVQGWIDGFDEKWGEKYTNLTDKFWDFIDDVKSIFHIHSPSKVTEEIGGNIAQGLVDGIIEGAKQLTQIFTVNITNRILSSFQTLAGQVNGWIGTISGALSGLVGTASNILSNVYNTVSGWASSIANRISGIASNIGSAIFTPAYASGGYPDVGQLFVAREAGPELVGTIGGQTAVANNDQIVTALRQGVYEAMISAMSMQSGNGSREVVLNVNGREFARAIYDDNRAVAREKGISFAS